VTGYGEIDGRSVALIATDFTVKGGSIGHAGGRKMSRVAERALDRGLPLLMLHDGGGHRIQEGLDAAPFARGDNGFSKLQTALSGWVPVVSAMMGPAFAAPTNFAALSDFVPIVEGTGTMGVAGPSLVEAALGVDGTKEELGSARFQTTETGMADLACEDDEACLDAIRTFLSYLPRNARREPPTADSRPPAVDGERLREIIPSSPRKGYDIDAIVEGIVDRDSVFELKPTYARNIVTAFARLEGSRSASSPTTPDQGRNHRYWRIGEGGPLRGDLRRLRAPGPHAGRRTRNPARPGLGTRGDRSPLREAPIRTRACDGPDR